MMNRLKRLKVRKIHARTGNYFRGDKGLSRR